MAAAPGVCCYLFVLVCEIEFLAVIVRIRHTFQLGKGLLGQRPHIPVHTRHMGKAYSEWKLNQDKEPVSEIDKKYQELLETLSPEQEEVITEYCNAIFSSGADTEKFFYRR